MEGLISLLLFAGLFFLMMRFGCGARNAYGGNEGHGGHGPACRWRGEHGSGLRHARLCGRGLRQDVSGQVLSLLFENLPRQFDVDPRRYLSKAKEGYEPGHTRGKRLMALVDQKRALGMAVKGRQVGRRWSQLGERLQVHEG